MSNVRVRIAPSPTGFLHIGTARTALFNWLFARQHDGTFVLRVEDTDVERSTQEFADALCDGFHWLGIEWDEGPEFGDMPQKGGYGPYRQSQRAELHRAAAQRLLEEGKAYKCFYTREEIEAMREQKGAERPLHREGKWRNASEADIAAQGDAPYAIRFRVPEGITGIDDLVQGKVSINNREIDDFVIVKPNGDPIFHLAVVADDGAMEISHVIRGEDHLSNTPRHVMLFEALGYPVPRFAHLPMVLTEQGKKMSKRDQGANLLDWRRDGYLAETLVNYIAFLGWNPGDDRELFTKEELIEAFDLERVSKSNARFGMKRVQFLNGQHIRRLSVEDLKNRLVPVLEQAGFDTSSKPDDWLREMTAICQEKLATLTDIVRFADFFFVEPTEYEEKPVRKHWQQDDALERMQLIRDAVATAEPWSGDALKERFKALAEERDEGLGKFIHPTRLALTGKSVGPGLFELAGLLGRETCLDRIDKGIDFIKDMGDEC